MESWQIFHVAKKKLSPGIIHNIYRKSARLITYWAANPRHCSVTKRNPIDRIRILLEELDLAGYGEYARAAIDYMAEPLGGRYTDIQPAKTDKGSVDGEVADISIALGELVSNIRQVDTNSDIDTARRIRIKNYARTLKIQIEQLLDAAGLGNASNKASGTGRDLGR